MIFFSYFHSRVARSWAFSSFHIFTVFYSWDYQNGWWLYMLDVHGDILISTIHPFPLILNKIYKLILFSLQNNRWMWINFRIWLTLLYFKKKMFLLILISFSLIWWFFIDQPWHAHFLSLCYLSYPQIHNICLYDFVGLNWH